jgi:putative ABC transport system permease protein
MPASDSSGTREPRLILRYFVIQEIRKYPFFFFLLFFTLTLGTSGLLGIRIVSYEVQERLRQNAKELLTSDLAVSARRQLKAKELKALQDVMSTVPYESYELIDIYSMLAHEKSKQSRLVEIRSYADNFPFYGKVEVNGQKLKSDGLYVSKDLATLWEIRPGDTVSVGVFKTNVKDVIDEDTSLGFRGFSLAPRVYLPLKALTKTGLINAATTGSFSVHYKLKNVDAQELRQKLYKALPDPSVRVTLPEETSEQSGRTIAVISNFMSLSALIGMVLALVGVFYLYQSQLLSRLKDFALFHLHGIQKSQIALGMILQFTLIFVLMLIFELVIVTKLYSSFSPLLSSELGLDLPAHPNLSSLLILLPILYLLSLSILLPLIFGLMRTSLGVQLKASKLSLGRFRFFDFIPFALLLWLMSWFLSENFYTGSIFFVGLLMVFLCSTGLITLLQVFLRSWAKKSSLSSPSLEWGLSLRSLSRSGHKLTLSFISLCLACTLISLILQLDSKIQGELTLSQKRPGLFIFDIQDDQIDEFTEFAKTFGTTLEAVTPMIRARLEKVNGVVFERKSNPFALRERAQNDDPRTQNNAVNLTYRDYLTSSEKIVKGTPFPPYEEGQEVALVSVEKRWGQRMGLKIGDHLLFDVQGIPFEGTVHNIKEVKWTSFYPNFFLTVQPGFLELAPKTYLAAFPGGHKNLKAPFQRETINRFPNISFIDVEELVTKLAALFTKSRQAVEVISWLSLLVGLVILYGLSHDQVYRRFYDLALLKSLGLERSRLRSQLLLEFGSLFAVSASLGFFLGWLMASLLGQEIFKLEWEMDWQRLFYPALILSVLCLFTILISSWRAVNSKPRELLSDS